MKIVRPLLFSISMIALALSQSGCLIAAAAAGTGAGVMYVKGKTVATLDGTPRTIAGATGQAMKDLGMLVISTDVSDTEATIVGRTSNDTKVETTVKTETDHTSKIFIRAGVFGDVAIQRQLLDRIRTNLGLPPEDPTTSTSSG